MRPHRFAFNFGYGFDSNDDAMTSVAFLFTSMFLELVLEVVIDIAALEIEKMHGIDVDKFWDMWQVNPGNFFGLHVSCAMIALGSAFWAFSTLPTPIFCISQHNPCSCTGGGFQIFKPFCTAVTASDKGVNATSSAENEYVLKKTQTLHVTPPVVRVMVSHPNSQEVKHNPLNLHNSTLSIIRSAAKSEYVSVFESLKDNTIVIITVVVVFVIMLFFALARGQLFAAKLQSEKDKISEERLDLQKANKKILKEKLRLQKQNTGIMKQLMSMQLNAKQMSIVEANSTDIDEYLSVALKLDWRSLTFEDRLGSGSFGDCFKGMCVSITRTQQTPLAHTSLKSKSTPCLFPIIAQRKAVPLRSSACAPGSSMKRGSRRSETRS